MKTLSLSFALVTALALSALEVIATPGKIIITRHANRVDSDEDRICLSVRGHTRAAAFVHFFSRTPEFNDPPISYIFAAYEGGPVPYLRCKQTIEPLAKHLGIPLNTKFERHETKEIAHEILTNPKYDGKTLLVTWNHHKLAELIAALGGGHPGAWGSDIFDQLYVITFDKSGKAHVKKELQKLLYGDRESFSDKPRVLPETDQPCPK